jgi:hypothetical protein
MSGEQISPNMSLPIPGVGVTDGPTWASDINASLTLVDQHDHTSGKGAQIPPAGLNINSDLSFQNNNAIALRSSRYQVNASPLALASDLGTTYVSGVDLYYNDVNGNQIRITQSGGVAGTPGSISNLVPPASATYVGGSSKFVWQSNTNTAADMDFGSAILRNLTVSSFALTLQPPTLSSNYSITLPTLPVSQKIMTLDASGNMAAPYTIDNSSLEIAANVIQVKAAGIQGTMLNSNVVDNSSLQLASNQLSIKPLGITYGMFAVGAVANFHSQTFTASGTFTVPAAVSNVLVVGCGGGGSGAGSDEIIYAAPGEAAPISVNVYAVTPLSNISVVVGSGGVYSGGSGGGRVNGVAGTASSFGTISFPGGLPGLIDANSTYSEFAVGKPGPFASGPASAPGGGAAIANSGAGGAGGYPAVAVGQGGNGGSGRVIVFWWV